VEGPIDWLAAVAKPVTIRSTSDENKSSHFQGMNFDLKLAGSEEVSLYLNVTARKTTDVVRTAVQVARYSSAQMV